MDLEPVKQWIRSNEHLQDKLSESEAAELLKLVRLYPLAKILRGLMDTMDDFTIQLANADLTTPEGVAVAQRLQGLRSGFHTALDMIFEPLEQMENTDG